MRDWTPLIRTIEQRGGVATLSVDEIEQLVGPLPPSAHKYAAWWSKGSNSLRPVHAAGFAARNVRLPASITFVHDASPAPPVVAQQVVARPVVERPLVTNAEPSPPRILLVGCVQTKIDRPAEARELFASPLFQKARAYAESTGDRWFILSAKWGLVHPTDWLSPYDVYLKAQSADYRAAWGSWVVAQLQREVPDWRGATFECHAGDSYVAPIRDSLLTLAHVSEPLTGLTMGQRLHWYDERRAGVPTPVAAPPQYLAALLSDVTRARPPRELQDADRARLRRPGLYSWWVDAEGAADLSRGLGLPVHEGLIYAGQAGATRSRSGSASGNTLYGRIAGMHLGGRARMSTLRLSLGSILATAFGWPAIDEGALTDWMHGYLRVIAEPVDGADFLEAQESELLQALDPPFNLRGRPPSQVRARLRELRRAFS